MTCQSSLLSVLVVCALAGAAQRPAMLSTVVRWAATAQRRLQFELVLYLVARVLIGMYTTCMTCDVQGFDYTAESRVSG